MELDVNWMEKNSLIFSQIQRTTHYHPLLQRPYTHIFPTNTPTQEAPTLFPTNSYYIHSVQFPPYTARNTVKINF
jgi:hypothetical protein